MLQNFSQTQGTVFHSSACISSSEGFFKNRSAHFCGKSPSSGACPSQIAILFSLWLKFLMKWKPTYIYGDLNFSDSQQLFANLFSWRKLEGSLIIFWKFQGRTPQEIWITAIFPARSKVVSYDVLHHKYSIGCVDILICKKRLSFKHLYMTFYYYPGQKKEPCSWCIKSESCDIEESWSLIQLRNRERTPLAAAATSRIDASQRNQAADSSISHDASPGWFFFFLARVVFGWSSSQAQHSLVSSFDWLQLGRPWPESRWFLTWYAVDRPTDSYFEVVAGLHKQNGIFLLFIVESRQVVTSLQTVQSIDCAERTICSKDNKKTCDKEAPSTSDLNNTCECNDSF